MGTSVYEADRTPHEVGARGGGARYCEWRIFQDHVKHEVVDSVALSTALACKQNILRSLQWPDLTLGVDGGRSLYGRLHRGRPRRS